MTIGPFELIINYIEDDAADITLMPIETATGKWLYCFQCYASHYHTLQPNGKYQCPNCHAERNTRW